MVGTDPTLQAPKAPNTEEQTPLRAGYPPERILMAPGPSNLHPRVKSALAAPLTGHRDPWFLSLMDETARMLRTVFQTRNQATLVLPGTGGSGMDAALINLLEPGDTVVVGRAGFFANRMVEIARRTGASLVVVDAPWGQPLQPHDLAAAVREHRPKVLSVVHGETSTGVEHSLRGLGEVCQETGAYLVVDAVASLGGTWLPVDELRIDVCYSGSQKCLSAPPGLAPITISDRALEAIRTRHTPVPSWYLDLTLHAAFWGEHVYHHTSPVLNLNALHAALELVLEEGLRERVARHDLNARALQAGLEALGLAPFASPGYRLAPVTTVLTPDGVDEAVIRQELLDEFGVEISGGLGDYAGKIWRIGVMGYSGRRSNVTLVLGALEMLLRRHGRLVSGGVAAAEQSYSGSASESG